MRPQPARDRARVASPHAPGGFELIAAAVDGRPEGRDAAALGAAIARAAGAELMLVAVHPSPPVVVPRQMGWTALHEQAGALLQGLRDELAPDARMAIETDLYVTRGLRRVVRREHRDLLVVGSSQAASQGQVMIGTRTRRLIDGAECASAVAPRGLSANVPQLVRIGVGYDGGPESAEALRRAAALAAAAGAQLRLRALVDDRLPALGWSPEAPRRQFQAMQDELLEPELDSLRSDAARAAAATSADVEVDVACGSPGRALIELSEQVDLLVIGSRRRGTAARVRLGRTGQALLQAAHCPVVVVPRVRSIEP